MSRGSVQAGLLLLCPPLAAEAEQRQASGTFPHQQASRAARSRLAAQPGTGQGRGSR